MQCAAITMSFCIIFKAKNSACGSHLECSDQVVAKDIWEMPRIAPIIMPILRNHRFCPVSVFVIQQTILSILLSLQNKPEAVSF